MSGLHVDGPFITPTIAELVLVEVATEQPIDTSAAAGKAFLDTLGGSLSSRRTCGRNDNWKRLQMPRPGVSTRGGRPASTLRNSEH
jgi:hypothetical protein